MSRVYLFALMPGGSRPVVMGRSKRPDQVSNEHERRAWVIRQIGDEDLAARAGGIGWWGERFPAWWLVEAESAEAGRFVIRTQRTDKCTDSGSTMCSAVKGTASGRILDSGGAK